MRADWDHRHGEHRRDRSAGYGSDRLRRDTPSGSGSGRNRDLPVSSYRQEQSRGNMSTRSSKGTTVKTPSLPTKNQEVPLVDPSFALLDEPQDHEIQQMLDGLEVQQEWNEVEYKSLFLDITTILRKAGQHIVLEAEYGATSLNTEPIAKIAAELPEPTAAEIEALLPKTAALSLEKCRARLNQMLLQLEACLVDFNMSLEQQRREAALLEETKKQCAEKRIHLTDIKRRLADQRMLEKSATEVMQYQSAEKLEEEMKHYASEEKHIRDNLSANSNCFILAQQTIAERIRMLREALLQTKDLRKRFGSLA